MIHGATCKCVLIIPNPSWIEHSIMDWSNACSDIAMEMSANSLLRSSCGEWCARTQIEKNVNNWIELMRLLPHMQLGAMPCVLTNSSNLASMLSKLRIMLEKNAKKLKWIHQVAAKHATWRNACRSCTSRGRWQLLSKVRILLEKNAKNWIEIIRLLQHMQLGAMPSLVSTPPTWLRVCPSCEFC